MTFTHCLTYLKWLGMGAVWLLIIWAFTVLLFSLERVVPAVAVFL